MSPLSPRQWGCGVEKEPSHSPPPPPSLTGKAIHVHQAAIVAAKRLITRSLMLKTRWRHWQPELPSREKELISSSLSSPFGGREQLRLRKPARGGMCSRRHGASAWAQAFRRRGSSGPGSSGRWRQASGPWASGSCRSSNAASGNNCSFKPAKGRRGGGKERESMSSNCQMVNIFAAFHQRINCRAAWGLRCTDHSDPDYPPLEPPPPRGGGRGLGVEAATVTHPVIFLSSHLGLLGSTLQNAKLLKQ